MFRKEKTFFLQRVMAAIETMDRWWETTRILHTGKSSSEIPKHGFMMLILQTQRESTASLPWQWRTLVEDFLKWLGKARFCLQGHQFISDLEVAVWEF